MSSKDFVIGIIIGGIIGYLIAKLVKEEKERIREIFKPLEHTCKW